MAKSKNTVAGIAIVCTVVIAVVFVLGTIWMGQSTKKDADRAARAVSLMYLDELAGRREQVVENNLQSSIQTIRVAIDLLTQEDLTDEKRIDIYLLLSRALKGQDRWEDALSQAKECLALAETAGFRARQPAVWNRIVDAIVVLYLQNGQTGMARLYENKKR